MWRRRRNLVGLTLLAVVAVAPLVAHISGAAVVTLAPPSLADGAVGRIGLPVTLPPTVTVTLPAVSPTVPPSVVPRLTQTVASVVTPTTTSTSTSTTSTSTSTSTTSSTSTTVAPTTTTIFNPCRNSTVPTCGPFRFDPQPGPDSPMTVKVVAEPASPVAGQAMVFHLTLTDPDGVSHGSSLFGFGDSGVGETSSDACRKFGPWSPPARDPSRATETLDVRHTYFGPGTYTATFTFDAGPFDCVDSVTGLGDRPYASGATGTVTVVVR